MNLRIAVVFALLWAFCSVGRAAESARAWPARPVRVIVPFLAGGGVDSGARIATNKLAAALGQPVVIDNRPGARGVIGVETVAKATPDGYTLLVVSEAFTIMPFIERNVQFDVRRSFAPVSLLATQPLVVAVHPSVPAQSMKDLIAIARGKPDAISFGSGGVAQHLAGEYIKKVGSFNMTHIPYKGGAQAIIDLAGGQLHAVVMGSSPVIPFARTGKVRILAVTSKSRSAALPSVPTLAESGLPGIDLFQWTFMLAPANTAKDRVSRLNAELAKLLALPETVQKFEAAGFEAASSTQQQLAAMIAEATDRWSKLIPELGLKVE